MIKSAFRCSTGFALCCVLVGSVAAQDWPQFRGPGGQGISKVTGLPTTWSNTENLLWKTTLPGAGASSPVSLGSKIYLTCYSGYGIGQPGTDISKLMRHVVCIKGEDGKILWDTKVPPSSPEQNEVRDHGYAAGTPATDGKHLYVFFGKSGVFKFDLQGKQLWQADVGSETTVGGPALLRCFAAMWSLSMPASKAKVWLL